MPFKNQKPREPLRLEFLHKLRPAGSLLQSVRSCMSKQLGVLFKRMFKTACFGLIPKCYKSSELSVPVSELYFNEHWMKRTIVPKSTQGSKSSKQRSDKEWLGHLQKDRPESILLRSRRNYTNENLEPNPRTWTILYQITSLEAVDKWKQGWSVRLESHLPGCLDSPKIFTRFMMLHDAKFTNFSHFTQPRRFLETAMWLLNRNPRISSGMVGALI